MIKDAFDILALPPRLDLSAQDIERAYLAKIALIHPDVAPDSLDALDLAAQINDARMTLAHPLTRGETLLARLGGLSASADKSLPPGFLMEIMELRESVEADLASGDPARKAVWTREAISRRDEFVAKLTPMFEQASRDVPMLGQVLSQLRTQLNAWRYTERLIEQL